MRFFGMLMLALALGCGLGRQRHSDVCDEYLACLSSTDAESFAALSPVFGPRGSCWDGDVESCDTACATGLATQHTAYPAETACGPAADADTDTDTDADADTDADTDRDSAMDTAYDEEPYAGPWQIAAVEWDCDADSWWYWARTDGWAGGVTVSIRETGASTPWTELDHELGERTWDPDGAWDELERTLIRVPSAGAVVPGATTLFTCGVHDTDNVTWLMEMFDPDQPSKRVDCVIWGHQPSYWSSQPGNARCVLL